MCINQIYSIPLHSLYHLNVWYFILRNFTLIQAWWLMAVTPVTWRVERAGLWFEVSPGKTLVKLYLKEQTGACYFMSVIPATWVAWVVRYWSPGHKAKTSVWKIIKAKRAGGVAQVLEHLPSKPQHCQNRNNIIIIIIIIMYSGR
jgi:hypothetical protein